MTIEWRHADLIKLFWHRGDAEIVSDNEFDDFDLPFWHITKWICVKQMQFSLIRQMALP